jgi:hypothetical protein
MFVVLLIADILATISQDCRQEEVRCDPLGPINHTFVAGLTGPFLPGSYALKEVSLAGLQVREK